MLMGNKTPPTITPRGGKTVKGSGLAQDLQRAPQGLPPRIKPRCGAAQKPQKGRRALKFLYTRRPPDYIPPMPSNYDPTEFVDSDFESQKSPSPFTGTAKNPGSAMRAPTREEVDSRVIEAQQKLTELKRVQEELERERAALEETRRRQIEFQTGREELIQSLTRAVGLLEETEFGARRDAEQMAKALVDLREGLTKVQAIHEETWTKDNFSMELTRALTALENARMEYNAARLKFPVLSGKTAGETAGQPGINTRSPEPLSSYSFFELCRMGLALTWPLALIGLLAVGVLMFFLLGH